MLPNIWTSGSFNVTNLLLVVGLKSPVFTTRRFVDVANFFSKVLRFVISFIKLTFELKTESSSPTALISGNKLAIAFSKGSLSPSAATSKLGIILERLVAEPTAETAEDTSLSKECPLAVNADPKSLVILLSKAVCGELPAASPAKLVNWDCKFIFGSAGIGGTNALNLLIVEVISVDKSVVTVDASLSMPVIIFET